MADDKGNRGALVVVEGLDRAGKSSQCELLYKSLLDMNYKTKYIRFPGAYSRTSVFVCMNLKAEV